MSDIVRKWLRTIDIKPKTVIIETIEFSDKPYWFTYTDNKYNTVVVKISRESAKELHLNLMEGMI